jgi:hypothetical protein
MGSTTVSRRLSPHKAAIPATISRGYSPASGWLQGNVPMEIGQPVCIRGNPLIGRLGELGNSRPFQKAN